MKYETIEDKLKYIYNFNYYYSSNAFITFINNKLNINTYIIHYYININKINDSKAFKIYINNHLLKFNNLPLILKYLSCNISNCNLPPNIIYLYNVFDLDFNNLPRNLQFLLIYNSRHSQFYKYKKYLILYNIIDYKYNNKKIKFMMCFNNIIKFNYLTS